MVELKPIEFRGDSLPALKGFPDSARRRAGFQLNLVQQGLDPDDWKPLSTVGPGVREIRIRDQSGIFRVMYVTKLGDTLFVLHCFQKKTQKTSATDIEMAKRRYKELQKEYSS